MVLGSEPVHFMIDFLDSEASRKGAAPNGRQASTIHLILV
jgi:hypothetical protein